MVVDFCHTVFSAWGSGGKDNIGSAVPMFGAGPEEPPWPVVAARDGWFVVFMIGAGADGPSIPGAAEIPLNESNFF